MQSRYYDVDWGRFVNGDSIIGKTGSLITTNMYAYCINNPINMKDPSGNISMGAAIYLIPGIGEVAIATSGTIIIGGIVIWAGFNVAKAIKNWIGNYGRIQIAQASQNINKKIKKSDTHVDLSKFTKRLPGKIPKFGGPLNWYIEKDKAGHGGRAWKLFDWAGNRIASIAKDGKILGK